VLAELLEHHLQLPSRPQNYISRPRVVQTSLFAGTEDPVLVALRGYDVAKATPEEVVAQVKQWQKELGGE
jgi:hypothetical protein